MSLVGILFGGGPGPDAIGYLELEVTLSESHSWANEVTSNPVEEGEETSDHIKPQPDIVTMQGLTTTTPLGGFLQLIQIGTAGNVQDAFDALYKLEKSGELVTVYTPLKTYEDMAVVNVDIPRSPQDGESISYTVECKHVRRVVSKTTELPEGIGEEQSDSVGSRAKQETKKGQQQNAPVEPERKSALVGILGG